LHRLRIGGAIFQTHFHSSVRHQFYHRYLIRHLPKDGRIFSIASGRAINEMKLAGDGYQLVCSDLGPICLEQTERLFPQCRYMRWELLSEPTSAQRFDAVMSLCLMYLLIPELLTGFSSACSKC